MRLEQCGHIVVRGLATVTWLDEDQIHVCWVTLLPSRRNLSALRFHFCWYLNSMSLIVLVIELIEKDIIKGLGLYIDGFLQGFSFCPPKICNPNKQTTWNSSHLLEFAWSSGKLDYDNLSAVFYDINVMNAEVFAKGLKKRRLLTGLLGQNVENLNDYCCPKFQDLVGEGKTDSSWICSSYPFRNKTRLHCAQKKAKVYGEWAMQIFCTCFLCLCLLL